MPQLHQNLALVSKNEGGSGRRTKKKGKENQKQKSLIQFNLKQT